MDPEESFNASRVSVSRPPKSSVAKISTTYEQSNREISRTGIQAGQSLQIRPLTQSAVSFPQTEQASLSNNDIALSGAVDQQLAYTSDSHSVAFRDLKLRNTTRHLSSMCCVKPTPSFDVLRPAIPILAQIIKTSQDEQVLADVCAALCSLSNGMSDQIQVLLEAGVAHRLVQLMSHDIFEVIPLP